MIFKLAYKSVHPITTSSLSLALSSLCLSLLSLSLCQLAEDEDTKASPYNPVLPLQSHAFAANSTLCPVPLQPPHKPLNHMAPLCPGEYQELDGAALQPRVPTVLKRECVRSPYSAVRPSSWPWAACWPLSSCRPWARVSSAVLKCAGPARRRR